MFVAELFRKLLPPPVAQANLTAAQKTPQLAKLHPRLSANVGRGHEEVMDGVSNSVTSRFGQP
jgi:hypothetical protein